jgi:hypothetical protein
MVRSPGRSVVLVGASNLAQGLGFALEESHARIGPAPHVFAVCGRGRSYGTSSSFLCRGLPAVLECGLWRALDARPDAALLADIGNDLAYGVEPARVLAWVRATAEKLAAERLVIAGLPRARLERLSRAAIVVWGRLIFPTRSLDPARVRASIVELDEGLSELARELGATKVELDPDWYGLDPIHFRRSARAEAWAALLAPFGPRREGAARLPPLSTAGLAPELSTFFGATRRREQPCRRSSDGGLLSLF